MAGLIRLDDIEAVRERAKIEEIVGERVTLKSAGVGALKGLCPFHDERTPSFQVRPAVGLWHCFGCGEGGDTISFIQRMDALSFAEAVEYLAGRYGVQLRYEDGGRPSGGLGSSGRQRLLELNRVAAEFYAEALASPEAQIGRDFLRQRGFDRAAADHFGVGYAPKAWDSLVRHLRARAYTDGELQAAGLASPGQRGLLDRFRGRLLWPIRDLTGAVVGFGARKLEEADTGPKYLNTPETALYKKSQLLYGADLAKRDIARQRQVVVVEGYTDVMAAHLAGVPTAIATCGTAFGADHIRVVRRLLGDSGDAAAGVITADGAARGGQIIFTFDGDAAGLKAAMRAFAEDQQFYAQTFVAIAPDGMDPCELRQERGDAAVRELVDSRQPLFRFAIRTVLAQLDLDTAEGRVAGLRAAAPVVAGIRDDALKRDYARQLAGWLGTDEASVVRAVRAAAGSRRRPGGRGDTGLSQSGGGGRPGAGGGAGPGGGQSGGGAPGGRPGVGGAGVPGGRVSGGVVPGGGAPGGRPVAGGGGVSGGPVPDSAVLGGGASSGWPDDGGPGGEGSVPIHSSAGSADWAASAAMPRARRGETDDPVVRVERRALEAVLQQPGLVPPQFDDLPASAFSVPAFRAVHDAIRAAGGVAAAVDSARWIDQVRGLAIAPVASLITELAVTALPVAPLPAESDRADPTIEYVRGVVGTLLELGVTRQIADLNGKLRRMDPTTDRPAYDAVFAQLVELENDRRRLRSDGTAG